MPSGETFPLPWEEVVWSSSPAFPASLVRPHTTYAFTDFRLVVRQRDRTVRELALDEVGRVSLTQGWWQRPFGTGTIIVQSRRTGASLEIADVRYSPQLAFILQLRVSGHFADDTGDIAGFFRSGLGAPGPLRVRPRPWHLVAATIVLALTFAAVGLARHESLPPVVYADNDPIAPHGQRRPTAAIIAFMERDVMAFARRTLAPLVGSASDVTCETCHGLNAEARAWRMPGVRALPAPTLRFTGLERAGPWLDPQVRNAVYGYLAEEDNQTVAGYMRQVVMPGMARLMNRPAYDFARSYGYNRSKAAVGCYHCHLVE